MNGPCKLLPGNLGQRGAALFTALILLVAITLITLASLGTSMMQLRMSANEELITTAFQSAQAAVDNVVNVDYVARQPLTVDVSKQYFKITGSVGYAQCSANWSGSGSCNTNAVSLTSPLDGSSSGANQIRVERKSNPVSTRNEKCGKAAQFEVESIYDRSAWGQGKSSIVQGYQACDYVGASSSMVPKTADHN